MSEVIFCGENPEIRLMKPGTTDQEVAFLSFWNCTYSPHGVGQALVLHTESLTLIHADNLPLGRFIADDLVRYFPDMHRANLPAVDVTEAKIFHHYGTIGKLSVHSTTADHDIRATWDEVVAIRPPRSYPDIISVPETNTALDVSTVICPVKQAKIVVNGVEIPGHVHSYHDGELRRSSAFLAFSETWTRHPQPS